MSRTLIPPSVKQILALSLSVLCVSYSSGQPGQIGVTSEWESTGFNNGRRIARDSNGYFHAVWHSKPSLPAGPSASGCEIYYAFTNAPAIEPPSMAVAGAWSPPILMSSPLQNYDNRYPSMAIEYEIVDGAWKQTNNLDIVWQAISEGGMRYEVLFAKILVSSPPSIPPPWAMAINLSMTPQTDSLVPSICINAHDPGNPAKQHIHVMWQEEDINPGQYGTSPPEDLWYSDIAYIRSVDSGITWAGPAGGWAGHPWDNITQTPMNSQMPSVSCILDQFTTSPAVTGRSDLGYNFQSVHVAFNEDLPGVVAPGINVYYMRSFDDGLTWQPRINVTIATRGEQPNLDAYPNVAVDMLDRPHIVFMRGGLIPREPMRNTQQGPPFYQPGINPVLWQAFPGPEAGMYGAMLNNVVYAYLDPQQQWYFIDWGSGMDNEFPTTALDRYQHVNVNWQMYLTGIKDYEVVRDTRLNMLPPLFPLVPQLYGLWGGVVYDSHDPVNDDLFPNLAHKKVAMYFSPVEPLIAGYDEVWTKIQGHGPEQAVNPAVFRQVWQDGNMKYDVNIAPSRVADYQLY
ncbi:MAG: hypothetical protein NTY46_12365 [Candidatus Sumerlaeota bacterium]|nr:hypothetical protein [Candidatus Sumerlaeota bacterium]